MRKLSLLFIVFIISIIIFFLIRPLLLRKHEPSYNVATRKIKNVIPGTFAYYHEYKHKLQHDNDIVTLWFTRTRYLYAIAVGLYLAVRGIDFFFIFISLPIILMLYMEFDAHLYAYKMTRKR